jgi:hypothetical protein
MTANKGTQLQNDAEKVEAKLQRDLPASVVEAAPGLMGQQMWMEQAIKEPGHARPEDVLSLQTQYGNQTIRRVIDPASEVQYSASDHGELDSYISAEIQRARTGGQALKLDIRREAGEQLGHDFGSVRLHTDHQADRLSRQIQAKAFTVGNDVFFRQNAYNPGTSRGRGTLNHELTHVMQQSGGSAGSGPLTLGKADDHFEQQADKVATMQSASVQSGRALQGGIVQREGFLSDLSTTISGTVGALKGIFKKKPPKPAPSGITGPGMTLKVWKKLEKNGMTGDIWKGISDDGQKAALIDQVGKSSKVFALLLDAVKKDKWPEDGEGEEIYDAAQLAAIVKSGKNVEQWNDIDDDYKGYLLNLGGEMDSEKLKGLAEVAEPGKWPKHKATPKPTPEDPDATEEKEITDAPSLEALSKTGIEYSKWNEIDEKYRGYLLGLANSSLSKLHFQLLVTAAKDGNWPKDKDEHEITTAPPLLRIMNFIKVSFGDWNEIKKEYRGFLLGLVGFLNSVYLQELALAKPGEWPKDNDDKEIENAEVLDALKETKVKYIEWNDIHKTHRDKVLALVGEIKDTYFDELVDVAKVAKGGKWPKGKADAETTDVETLIQIRKDIELKYPDWCAIVKQEKRKFLLESKLSKKNKRDLAKVAENNWPKDGSDTDTEIYNVTQFNSIVKTGIGFTNWNATGKTYRGYLLSIGGDMKSAKLKKLAGVAEETKWPRHKATPKDPQDPTGEKEEKEITDAPTLKALSKTGIAYSKWNDIKEKYRGYLLALSSADKLASSYLKELASLVSGGVDKWPKDVTDTDLTDHVKLTKIRKKISLTYAKWLDISEAKHRKALFTQVQDRNKWLPELGLLAADDGKWPLDGDGEVIEDVKQLTKIRKEYSLSYKEWCGISAKGQRSFLLGVKIIPAVLELAKAATAGNWPQNAEDPEADIVDLNVLNYIRKTGISLSKWNDTEKVYRGYLLSYAGDKPGKIKKLGGVAKPGKWPKHKATEDPDDPTKTVELEIKDKSKLDALLKTGIAYSEWNDINEKYRGYLLTLAGSNLPGNYLKELAKVAKGGKWPLNDTGVDIESVDYLKEIRTDINLSYKKWCGIGVKEQRGALHTLPTMKEELGKAAVKGKWPTDGTGATKYIYDETKLKKIRNDLKVTFRQWANTKNFKDDRKKAILAMTNSGYALELAQFTNDGSWPVDITSGNIAKWEAIKDNEKTLSAKEWNSFNQTERTAVLAAGTADISNKINEIRQAEHRSQTSKWYEFWKLKSIHQRTADITGSETSTVTTGVAGGASSLFGMTGSILSATKGSGQGDRQTMGNLDIASGSFGAAADVLDLGTESWSLLGSVSSIFRGGQRRAGKKRGPFRKGHASRAAKKVGKQEQWKGAVGAAGSGVGILGSLANLGSNIAKIVGGGQEKAEEGKGAGAGIASGVLGVTSGLLGMGKGLYGITEGIIKTVKSGERMYAANKYIKTNTADPDEKKELAKIAAFTKKNQKIVGRSLSIVNSGLSGVGGLLGVGSSIAGFFPGAGGGIAGSSIDGVSAFFSLCGLATGPVTQTITDLAEGKQEQKMDDNVKMLIGLLKGKPPSSASAPYDKAAEFAKKVLNIGLIDLTAGKEETYSDWIDEDEESAKDYIKARMAKS